MIHGLLDQIQPGASDDEDDDRPDGSYVFSGVKPGGGLDPESCRVLIICAPGAAAAFGLCFASEALPWRLEAKDRGSFPASKPPRFFQRAGCEAATAVAVLDGPVQPEAAAAWAECLLRAVPAAEVLFLDRTFLAEWRAVGDAQRPQEPHLAALWSSHWGPKGPLGSGPGGGIAPLPLPNMLQGLGAAVLTECEAARRRCICVLTVQDGAHIAEGCVGAFQRLAPLLEELGVVGPAWRLPNLRDVIRQVVPPASMSIYA